MANREARVIGAVPVTIKIRTSKRGYLEVDIITRMPDGTTQRERRKSPASSVSGTQRWAEARQREILTDGLKPKVPVEPVRPVVPTLADFWKRFLSNHVKANNQKPSGQESKEYGYRTFLEPAFGTMRLDDITTAKVAGLKSSMVGKKYSASTVNNTLALLSKMLKVAIDWGELPAMPCKIQRLKTQQATATFYEEDVYERLVVAAKNIDPRYHLLVLLGGDAGLRRGEIMALDQSACDTKRGLLSIEWSTWRNHRLETKGMEARVIPMTDRLREAIKAYRHLRGPRLMYGDRGGAVTGTCLRDWMATVAKAAGVPSKGALHVLRHTFCSHLAMKGVPAGSIQKLAGHKHLVTSLRYMHLAEGETHRAIKLLGRGAGLDPSQKDATFSG